MKCLITHFACNIYMFNIIDHLLFIPISGCLKGPSSPVCPGAHNIAKMALMFLQELLTVYCNMVLKHVFTTLITIS